jgi:diguanylate cyclase (GGDEF)-like protein
MAIGTLMVAFRGFVSPFVTVIMANFLILLGTALYYISICRFVSRKYSYGLILIAAVPILLLFPYYTFVDENLAARVVIMSFSSALLIGTASFRLLETRQSTFRLSSFVLAVVTGVYAIVMVARGVGVMIYRPTDVYMQNLILIFHAVVMFVAVLLWSAGFTLMVGQRLQADLMELSTMDSLTRVMNRRGMTRLLEAEFARKARAFTNFSILLIDVDRFKSINDTHGHQMGDMVLQSLAETMSGFIRQQDFVSRWGGEEFVILLPSTEAREAMDVGERLRQLIAAQPFMIENQLMPVTISIGIASSDHCSNLADIYRVADQALYKAKLVRNAVAVNGLGAKQLMEV